jgi:hypothetical protein
VFQRSSSARVPSVNRTTSCVSTTLSVSANTGASSGASADASCSAVILPARKSFSAARNASNTTVTPPWHTPTWHAPRAHTQLHTPCARYTWRDDRTSTSAFNSCREASTLSPRRCPTWPSRRKKLAPRSLRTAASHRLAAARGTRDSGRTPAAWQHVAKTKQTTPAQPRGRSPCSHDVLIVNRHRRGSGEHDVLGRLNSKAANTNDQYAQLNQLHIQYTHTTVSGRCSSRRTSSTAASTTSRHTSTPQQTSGVRDPREAPRVTEQISKGDPTRPRCGCGVGSARAEAKAHQKMAAKPSCSCTRRPHLCHRLQTVRTDLARKSVHERSVRFSLRRTPPHHSNASCAQPPFLSSPRNTGRPTPQHSSTPLRPLNCITNKIAAAPVPQPQRCAAEAVAQNAPWQQDEGRPVAVESPHAGCVPQSLHRVVAVS